MDNTAAGTVRAQTHMMTWLQCFQSSRAAWNASSQTNTKPFGVGSGGPGKCTLCVAHMQLWTYAAHIILWSAHTPPPCNQLTPGMIRQANAQASSIVALQWYWHMPCWPEFTDCILTTNTNAGVGISMLTRSTSTGMSADKDKPVGVLQHATGKLK